MTYREVEYGREPGVVVVPGEAQKPTPNREFLGAVGNHYLIGRHIFFASHPHESTARTVELFENYPYQYPISSYIIVLWQAMACIERW